MGCVSTGPVGRDGTIVPYTQKRGGLGKKNFEALTANIWPKHKSKTVKKSSNMSIS